MWELADISDSDYLWVKVVAEIRLNSTGEIREYESEEILSDEEAHPNFFNWAENNYSCDCNRELFFLRAAGESEDGTEDTVCTDGLYSVNLRNPVDGEVYYREFT